MLVKKEEWDKLSNYKEELERQYKAKLEEKDKIISELKVVIKELEEKVKPNTIEINCYTREVDRNGYWKDHFSIQLDKITIDLSSGIVRQMYKILNTLRQGMNTVFEKRLKEKQDTIDKLKAQRGSFIYQINKLPKFVTRKRIQNIYDEIYEIKH